jgi:hypothetical protein
LAALPVCVPRLQAPLMGFEPTISTVTGSRGLRAPLQGQQKRDPRDQGDQRTKLRGLESNQRPLASKASTAANCGFPGEQDAARGEGFEPSLAVSETAGLPVSRSPSQSGRRGSRTLKAHRSAVFETAAVASRLAPPFKLRWQESNHAIVSLTASRVTVAPHRKVSRDGWIRTSVLVLPRHATTPGWSTSRLPEHPAGFEPAHPPWQGSRLPGYIMGAWLPPRCQRTVRSSGTRGT